MYNVVLSIDGRKEINDRMRTLKNGGGSYDKILPNIKALVDKRQGKNYYVRGTFTRYNLDFSEDVLHLLELGFEQISLEPVVAPKNADYSILEENLPKLFSEYDRLTEIICESKGKEFNFFHFNIDLTGGSCVQKRISGCGAGCEYLSVIPDGSLYPCHQFTGLEGFKVGSVSDGIQNEGLTKKFRAVNVYKKQECRDCWAKFYCSGGCAANAYQFSGDIAGNYKIGCELQKKRIECAIYTQIVKNNID